MFQFWIYTNLNCSAFTLNQMHVNGYDYVNLFIPHAKEYLLSLLLFFIFRFGGGSSVSFYSSFYVSEFVNMMMSK